MRSDRRRLLVWLAYAIALGTTLAPLLVTYDVPLIDLPGHLASIDVWNRWDQPELGYAQYYDVNVTLVPYWTYYWSVRLVSFLMPLRLANKVVMALMFVGMFLGYRAFLAAHRRPTVLAVGAGLFCWSWSTMWGFLAYAVGVGLLLWGYALLARMRDARPWPRRGLVVANVLVGCALLLTHPVLLLLWLVGVLVYLPNRSALIALPSLALLALTLRRAGAAEPSFIVQGVWQSPGKNLLDAYQYHLAGWFPARAPWIYCAMLLTVVLGWWLTARGPAGGSHPYRLFAALVVAYLVLPLHLQQPTDLAILNARIVTVVAMVGLACIPAGRLESWRAAAVIAPVLVMTVVYHGQLVRAFRHFDGRNEAFYEVARRLPMNPAVATLIYDTSDGELGAPIYRRYAGYVQLERGGYNPTFFRRGISDARFPAGYKKGPPPFPPIDVVGDFRWQRDWARFDYYLTRREPKRAFAGRPEVELVVERGDWRLWKRLK